MEISGKSWIKILYKKKYQVNPKPKKEYVKKEIPGESWRKERIWKKKTKNKYEENPEQQKAYKKKK